MPREIPVASDHTLQTDRDPEFTTECREPLLRACAYHITRRRSGVQLCAAGDIVHGTRSMSTSTACRCTCRCQWAGPSSGSGSITISSLTSTGVSGTFAFTAVPATLTTPAEDKVVANGTFTATF